MGVSLAKGGNVSLSKADPGMTRLLIGLGWNPRATTGTEFDIDSSVFLLNEGGKVRSDSDFIFYNNKTSADGSIVHGGDNRTGAGEGDDETVNVELTKVPAEIHKLCVGVTIHDADARRQNFGMVANAYIRVVNADTKSEIARYDLSEDASVETAMVFGEIYRHNGEWKFKAVGQGFAGGLGAMATSYGVNIG